MSMVWDCRSGSPYLPSPRRSLSLLPSLPPPAGVAFLSFPPHSHAGSHRRERTAAPRPVWNARKFWNLKPWREYLPGGSPESVSSPKTQTRSVFSWRKKCKFDRGTGGNIQAASPLPLAEFTVFPYPLSASRRTRRRIADTRPLVAVLPVCSPGLPCEIHPKPNCKTADNPGSELL